MSIIFQHLPDIVLLFDDWDNPLNDQTDPFRPRELKNLRRFGGVGQPVKLLNLGIN